jgi:hypothetical protein
MARGGEVTGKKPKQTITRAQRKLGPPRRNDSSAIEPVKHDEPSPAAARAQPQPIRGPPVAPACFSIKTFCLAHHISEAMFFKLREMGIGPDVMQVGRRVLITFESAARWRSQREAAASAAE